MYLTLHINKKILYWLFPIILMIISLFIFRNIHPIPSNTENMEFRVAVDPGHGSIDTGTHHNDLYEKNINLDIAKKLEKELLRANIIPIMTRTEDKLYQDSRNSDIRHRPKLAKQENADLFISIHVNNFPSSQPSGSQIFYKPGSEESKKLAKLIKTELVKLRPENDRSITSGNYYVLKKAPCPAVLIETGFISNEVDRKKLVNTQYQASMARGIKTGIISYFQTKLSMEDENKQINQKKTNNSAQMNLNQTIQHKRESELSLYYLGKDDQIKLTKRNFSYPAGTFIKNEYTGLSFKEILAKMALKELKAAPENLISVLPDATQIRSININQNKITVDFSSEIQTNFTGGAGTELLVYRAIKETLFSIPGIDEIEILINGKKNQSIGGHIVLQTIYKDK